MVHMCTRWGSLDDDVPVHPMSLSEHLQEGPRHIVSRGRLGNEVYYKSESQRVLGTEVQYCTKQFDGSLSGDEDS